MLPDAFLSTLLLLGGLPNTNVFYAPNGDLHVIGDAGANDVLMDAGVGYKRVRVPFGQSLNGIPGPTEFRLDPVQGVLRISLGDGDDVFFIMSNIADRRVFDMGAGDDFIDVGNVVSTHTTILAGDGDDHVHTEDCSYDTLEVDLGAGADDFEVAFTLIYRAITVDAGTGADRVRLRRSLFFGPVFAYGGLGVDSFLDILSEFAERPTVNGFESKLVR
jgi:hypothetical protein